MSGDRRFPWLGFAVVIGTVYLCKKAVWLGEAVYAARRTREKQPEESHEEHDQGHRR